MLDFPANPTELQEYTVGDRTWVWTNRAWRLKTVSNSNLTSIMNLTPDDGEILEFDLSTNKWDATKAPRDLYIDGGSF